MKKGFDSDMQNGAGGSSASSTFPFVQQVTIAGVGAGGSGLGVEEFKACRKAFENGHDRFHRSGDTYAITATAQRWEEFQRGWSAHSLYSLEEK